MSGKCARELWAELHQAALGHEPGRQRGVGAAAHEPRGQKGGCCMSLRVVQIHACWVMYMYALSV